MILELGSLVVAGLLGALAHEVAHWLVWRAAGRAPRMYWWKLQVRPTAGPQRTTRADRVAAVAPYVLGVLSVLVGLELGSWPLVFFGLFAFQVPSAVDLQTMLGRVEWRLDAV